MNERTIAPISLDDVTEELVIEYIRSHPEFFRRHVDLLQNLTIPHPCGDAVSLIERQVEYLRTKYQALKTSMEETITIAQENERLFESTKHLTLRLLQAKSLADVFQQIKKSIQHDFKADYIRLGLLQVVKAEATFVYHFVPDEELKDQLKGNKSIIQQFSDPQKYRLFGCDLAEKVASMVIVPLGQQGRVGVLAIGSRDKHHFHKDMDTLFLDYIGKILGQVIPRLQ